MGLASVPKLKSRILYWEFAVMVCGYTLEQLCDSAAAVVSHSPDVALQI